MTTSLSQSKGAYMAGTKQVVTVICDYSFLLLLALLTVNRFSPECLNADVLLNSVMSLQNITLFYWGQNRLANILPLVVSQIRDPALNLYACLLIPTVVFYGLIWFWADRLSKIKFQESEHNLARREAFLILISIFLFCAKPFTVFVIATWHIEYPLPCLLLGIAFYFYFGKRKTLIIRLAVTGVCLAVAVGVNNSIIIPAMTLVGGRAFFKRKIDIDSLIFSGLVVTLFILWGMIARFYPSPGISYYTIFKFAQLNHSVQVITNNLTDALNLGNAVIVILAACLLKIFAFSLPQEKASSDWPIQGTFMAMMLVFSCVWTLLLSVNPWVVANKFSFRYFVPLLFVGMMRLSFEVRNIAVILSRRNRYVLSVALAVWLVVHLSQPFVFLNDYSVFKRYDKVFPDDTVGYAGDYWSIWPAVMKNIFDKKIGIGFNERSISNQDYITQYFSSVERQRANLTIGCLNAPINQCLSQVKSFLGDVGLNDAELIGDSTWLLHIYFMNEPLTDGDFALMLSADNIPLQWHIKEMNVCSLKVKNNGKYALSGYGTYPIHLSYRWIKADTTSTSAEPGFGARTALPAVVNPNTIIIQYIEVYAPSTPGKYWLEIEAVQELVAWFKDKGSPGLRIEAEVK